MERIKELFLALTPAQIISLLVMLAALYVSRKVVRKALSAALTVLAILAGLYFLAPELFAAILNAIKHLF